MVGGGIWEILFPKGNEGNEEKACQLLSGPFLFVGFWFG